MWRLGRNCHCDLLTTIDLPRRCPVDGHTAAIGGASACSEARVGKKCHRREGEVPAPEVLIAIGSSATGAGAVPDAGCRGGGILGGIEKQGFPIAAHHAVGGNIVLSHVLGERSSCCRI